MILYLLIPILIILFFKNINSNKMTIPDYIILITMILICGLRYQVGTDYGLYTKIFNNINAFPRIETFFTVLINFLNNINFNEYAFFFVVAMLTLSITYLAIKKCAKHPAESLLLYICLGYFALQFNIIRQMLAVSILMYGCKYIIKRNFIKYLITVIIAGLCHTTAFIMLPFYFIANMNFSKKILTTILIFLFGLSFLYNPIINFITNNIPAYSVYASINSYTYDSAGIGTYLILIFNLFFMICILNNSKKLVDYDSDNKIYINITIFSFFFYFLSITNTVMVRPAYYFSIYFIYLLPDLYRVSKLKLNNKNSIMLIIIFISYYIIHLIFFNSMLPYKTILFK